MRRPRDENFTSLLAALTLLIYCCVTVAATAEDPVVIQVGDMQQTRSEFEQQFGMAMVLTAVLAGAPVKSGMQIRDLREHYLEQRVAEMLLLQQAKLRGVSVTESELDAEVSDFMQVLAEQYNSEQKSGLADDVHVRNYLRERLVLRRVRQVLINEGGLHQTEKIAVVEFIDGLVRQYRRLTVVHTYPERLE